jgi:hypothetical protein
LAAGNLRFLLLRLMQVAFVHQILHHIRQIFLEILFEKLQLLRIEINL